MKTTRKTTSSSLSFPKIVSPWFKKWDRPMVDYRGGLEIYNIYLTRGILVGSIVK